MQNPSVVVIDRYSEVWTMPRVPIQLAHSSLSPIVFAAISDAVFQSQTEGEGCACLVECTICILTGITLLHHIFLRIVKCIFIFI